MKLWEWTTEERGRERRRGGCRWREIIYKNGGTEKQDYEEGKKDVAGWTVGRKEAKTGMEG